MIRLLIAAIFAMVTTGAAFAGEKIVHAQAMAGKINGGAHDKRFFGIEDDLYLDIDAGSIVKGDRLDIYVATEDDASAMRRVGRLVVISSSTERPMGRITSASMEIPKDAYLAFPSGRWDLFTPFYQSLADAYFTNATNGKIRLAVIDAVNPLGDRTVLSDAVFGALYGGICAKPQFECVPREKVAEEIWRGHAGTSRNVDEHVIHGIRAATGADVIVTGHVVSTGGAADVAWRAVSVDTAVKPESVWRRFRIDMAAFGVSMDNAEKVIAGRGQSIRGYLRASLKDVATVQGAEVDYFFHEDLANYADSPQSAGARGFYLKIDGREYPLQMGGVFFDGTIPAGTHTLAMGYYVADSKDRSAPDRDKRKSFERTFDVYIGEAEKADIAIMGKIEKNHVILAATVQ